MNPILSLIVLAGAFLQAPPPLAPPAWTRAPSAVDFVTADPTWLIPDGKGGVRPATPEEMAALTEELSRVPKGCAWAQEFVEAGKRGKAIESLEALYAEADSVRVSALLAELYLLDGRPLLARGIVAARIGQSDDRRLLLVAAALNVEAGTVVPGQVAYCRNAAGESGETEYAKAANAALARTTNTTALAYLALGREWSSRPRTAGAYYERAWKADRGNPVVAYRLAKTLLVEGRSEEARKIAEEGKARATGALREALERP